MSESERQSDDSHAAGDGFDRVAGMALRRPSPAGAVNYGAVEVLLLDRDLAMRHLIRSALHGIGFRHVVECRSVQEVAQTVSQRQVDLLLLDLDTDTAQVCDTIRDIRNHRYGHNPFIVVMAMTWTPERKIITQTLDAGTDDVLAKPVSAAVLRERVLNLVQARKDFVVTTNYLGPDRRQQPRLGETDLPAIAVPNGLRYKATGDKQAIADPQQIGQAMRTVRTHRVCRSALSLAAAIHRLEKLARASSTADVTALQVNDMANQIGAISGAIREEGLGKLTPIADSMAAMVSGIRTGRDATIRHFEILRLHALAMAATIQENEQAAKLVTDSLNEATSLLNRPARKRKAAR